MFAFRDKAKRLHKSSHVSNVSYVSNVCNLSNVANVYTVSYVCEPAASVTASLYIVSACKQPEEKPCMIHLLHCDYLFTWLNPVSTYKQTKLNFRTQSAYAPLLKRSQPKISFSDCLVYALCI